MLDEYPKTGYSVNMATAKGFLDGQGRRLAEALLSAIKTDAAYFQARPFLDWNPFARFSHLCSSFIFCDPEARGNRFDEWVQALNNTPQGQRLKAETDLWLPYITGARNALGFQDGESKWIGGATVKRAIGGIARELKVYVFREEAYKVPGTKCGFTRHKVVLSWFGSRAVQ